MINWRNIFLRTWRPYFWIALLGAAVYGKTLLFSLVHYDDVYLLDNARLFGYLPDFPKLFFQGVFLRGLTAIYRPMLVVSFIVDYWIGGYDPSMYHLTNLILHLVTTSLIFLLLQKLGYQQWLAFIFALIFSVHPALTNTVAWIPGRNDSLLAIFTLVSFVYLIDYWPGRQLKYYWRHLLFFALALLTKENAAVIPLVFITYLYLASQEKPSFQTVRALLLGWLATLVGWGLIKQSVVTAGAHLTIFEQARGFLMNLPIIFPAFIQYLGKAILPLNLSAVTLASQINLTYGLVSIILLLLLFTYFRPRRWGMAAVGLGWFVLFLLPTFQLYTGFLIDNRLYLPIIGLILVFLETDLFKNARAGVTLGLLVIAIFGLSAFRLSDIYQDRLTFWGNVIKSAPNFGPAHNDLASGYLAANKLKEAEQEFKLAIGLAPNFAGSWFGLGTLYFQQGKLEESRTACQRSIAIDPNFFEAYNLLGLIYQKKGNYAKAEILFKKTLQINPLCQAAQLNLASLKQRR